MSTLGKLMLGAMGALRPKPLSGGEARTIVLPPPSMDGGGRLKAALQLRGSSRAYRVAPLPESLLSTLLWAANGVNRGGKGRTAPSALGNHEIDVLVALPDGTYRFDPERHRLECVCANDVRRVTGYQDFVDHAALDLVYVADHRRMGLVPVDQRTRYACVAAGAMAQNVYLFCADAGLATVLRAWIDRNALSEALGLRHDQEVLLAQTVGFPAH